MGDTINGNKIIFGNGSKMINIQLNVGNQSENRDSQNEETKHGEVSEKPEEKNGSKPDNLNYNSPRINLQRMIDGEWFDKVCARKDIYNKAWRSKLVSDLMMSVHGKHIATLWTNQKKVPTIKGKFVGALVYAGVLKGSNLSIAKACLGFDSKTKDKDEMREANTFAQYMGKYKEEPYIDWIKDYVDRIPQKD